MKHTLGHLYKYNDYKTCKNCGVINWYENCECINCESESFKHWTFEESIDYIRREIKYYKVDFPKMSDESILEIEVDV